MIVNKNMIWGFKVKERSFLSTVLKRVYNVFTEILLKTEQRKKNDLKWIKNLGTYPTWPNSFVHFICYLSLPTNSLESQKLFESGPPSGVLHSDCGGNGDFI